MLDSFGGWVRRSKKGRNMNVVARDATEYSSRFYDTSADFAQHRHKMQNFPHSLAGVRQELPPELPPIPGR